MKILILANYGMGLYNFRKELLERLVDEGHQVVLSLPNDNFKVKFQAIGCKVIDTPVDRRGTNPFSDLKLLWKYVIMQRKINPDIVLTYTIKPNIYGGIASQITRSPYITNITGLGTSMHSGDFLQKVILGLYKFSLRNSSCIFFQNESNFNFFRNHSLINTKKKLIPGSGVNTKEYSYMEYPDNDNVIRFLFVGRIMKDKGIDELLDVATRISINYENIEFHLVGFEEEIYQSKLERLEKDGVINFHGKQNNIQKYYEMCHALVHPSYHEGMSNVMLEAASCGRPVVASNIPGCKEIFDEGITGLGFEPKNANSLNNAIIEFIELSYIEKKKMGILGREKIVDEFDRNIVVDTYMNVMYEISEGL